MKNKLINITGAILLLIAIAFCSCKENKSYLDKDKVRGEVLGAKVLPTPQPIYNNYDSVVRQEIGYSNTSNTQYTLRTIAVSGLNQTGIKTTADFNFYLQLGHIIYDKKISGSFNYIKNRKHEYFKIAEKYLLNAYKNKAVTDNKYKLISDSINLLNSY